jgi:hypothetical protein
MAQKTSVHAEAGMHRKLVLFAMQLEGYLAHFPHRHKYTLTQGIRQHLLMMGLEISHYSLQPIRRGANFCGFRTWASARFVRPHVISALRTDARRGRLDGVISRLSHARHTNSFNPLLSYLQDKHHDLYLRLPKSLHAAHHNPDGAARLARA